MDILRYGLACLLLAFAGVGLLRLLRVQLAPGAGLLIGAGLSKAWLACALSIGVIAEIPGKLLVWPAWAVLIALAAIGLHARPWRADASDTSDTGGRQAAAWLLAVSLAAPLLVMLPHVIYGLADYPGSGALDGWAYSAIGQYLWEHAREGAGPRSLIDAYASEMVHTRLVAPLELGFWSPLFRAGDTQAPASLLQAVALFVFGSACAGLARTLGWATPRIAATIFVCVVSGWSLDLVWANNYDNSLALAYVPTLATLSAAATGGGVVVLTAAGFAGAIYTYPEFAVLVLGMVGLFTLEQARVRRSPRVIGGLVLALALTVPIVWPYAHDLRLFVSNQITAGFAGGGRPGEGMFAGLTTPGLRRGAYFGLGTEIGPVRAAGLLTRLSVVLAALLAAGCLFLLRARTFVVPIIVAATIGGSLWLIAHSNYSYGAYKVLAFGWWAFAFAIVTGATQGAALLGRPRRLWLAGACALIAIAPAAALLRVGSTLRTPPAETMADYRALEQGVAVVKGAPVALITPHWTRLSWGTYFLRHARAIIPMREGYLGAPQYQRVLDEANGGPVEQVRYVVTETRLDAGVQPAGWTALWSGRAFTIWDTGASGWAVVTAVRSNGAATDTPPRPVFVVGPRSSTLRVMANRAGRLELTATLAPPPGMPADVCWRLNLRGSDQIARDVRLRPGGVTISLPVPAGASTLALVEAPITPSPSGPGDAAVHVADLKTTWRPLADDARTPAPSTFSHYTPCAIEETLVAGEPAPARP